MWNRSVLSQKQFTVLFSHYSSATKTNSFCISSCHIKLTPVTKWCYFCDSYSPLLIYPIFCIFGLWLSVTCHQNWSRSSSLSASDLLGHTRVEQDKPGSIESRQISFEEAGPEAGEQGKRWRFEGYYHIPYLPFHCLIPPRSPSSFLHTDISECSFLSVVTNLSVTGRRKAFVFCALEGKALLMVNDHKAKSPFQNSCRGAGSKRMLHCSSFRFSKLSGAESNQKQCQSVTGYGNISGLITAL